MTTPTEKEERVITAGRKEGRKVNYSTITCNDPVRKVGHRHVCVLILR
jgi:hypothetical protein